MNGLLYPYYVHQPVINQFLTDDEINQKLKKLEIQNYATLERLNDQLIIEFEIPGNKFIRLSDLINFKKVQKQQFDFQYAIIIINSILEEFQNKYEKNIINVSFNLEDIQIGNEFKKEKQVEVIFTNIYFEFNISPNIQTLKQNIIQLLKLFQESNISNAITEIEQCKIINDISSIIKKQITNCRQINRYQALDYKHLEIIFNKPNKISQQMNEKNYYIIKSNIINWIYQNTIYQLQSRAIQNLIKILLLKKYFQNQIQKKDIFFILKESQLLNQLSNLQNIENFIYILTFSTRNIKPQIKSPEEQRDLTKIWIEKVEYNIKTQIDIYIKNLFEFYKGDKEDWMNVDFKIIFNRVRQYFTIKISEYKDYTIIKIYDIVQQITLDIIKQYYEEKVDKINQDIVKLIFKQK